MLESLVTRMVKLWKQGQVIGEQTTMVCTSHYGQPEWSGCTDQLHIGDELVVEDTNGGPPWTARVVGVDPYDGWCLVEAADCADRFYAIHPHNGWINNIECDQCADPDDVVSALTAGTAKLQFGVRLDDGWGCL